MAFILPIWARGFVTWKKERMQANRIALQDFLPAEGSLTKRFGILSCGMSLISFTEYVTSPFQRKSSSPQSQ
jgi:hypothetical protein